MIDQNGYIVSIWKQPDWTSNDVIKFLKPLISPLKVGHAGTLDPFAEGVLVLCAGKMTKQVSKIMDYEKQYYAKFDRFTKHGGWNNYDNNSNDEIKLPDNFPSLGSIFTLEALVYSNDSTSDYHQKIIGNLIFRGNNRFILIKMLQILIIMTKRENRAIK